MTARQGFDVRPIAIEDEFAARQIFEIAVLCVVRDVAFEEDDMPTALRERALKPAPQRRMAVAPGRTQVRPNTTSFMLYPSTDGLIDAQDCCALVVHHQLRD